MYVCKKKKCAVTIRTKGIQMHKPINLIDPRCYVELWSKIQMQWFHIKGKNPGQSRSSWSLYWSLCLFDQVANQEGNHYSMAKFIFTVPGLHCRIVKTCCCHHWLRGWETGSQPPPYSCVTQNSLKNRSVSPWPHQGESWRRERLSYTKDSV